MRISDWSSDVCSSDLLALRIPFCMIGIADMLDLAPGNEHIVEIGHRIEFVADRGERPEIGRASCRERVCQYVEIAGVDVALKKKNKHKKVRGTCSNIWT